MASSPVHVQIGKAKYATRVTAGEHQWVADEPGPLGGADTGPSPYDMLLAALGSCKVITARMYADRKGWPLDAVSLTLEHVREAGGEVIRVQATVTGDLDAEQRRRVIEIMEKCPVHKTISGGVRIEMVDASRAAGPAVGPITPGAVVTGSAVQIAG